MKAKLYGSQSSLEDCGYFGPMYIDIPPGYVRVHPNALPVEGDLVFDVDNDTFTPVHWYDCDSYARDFWLVVRKGPDAAIAEIWSME